MTDRRQFLKTIAAGCAASMAVPSILQAKDNNKVKPIITPEGLLRSLKTAIDETDKSGDYISLVKETVGKWKPRALPEEIGKVCSVADGGKH